MDYGCFCLKILSITLNTCNFNYVYYEINIGGSCRRGWRKHPNRDRYGKREFWLSSRNDNVEFDEGKERWFVATTRWEDGGAKETASSYAGFFVERRFGKFAKWIKQGEPIFFFSFFFLRNSCFNFSYCYIVAFIVLFFLIVILFLCAGWGKRTKRRQQTNRQKTTLEVLQNGGHSSYSSCHRWRTKEKNRKSKYCNKR